MTDKRQRLEDTRAFLIDSRDPIDQAIAEITAALYQLEIGATDAETEAAAALDHARGTVIELSRKFQPAERSIVDQWWKAPAEKDPER